MDSLNVKAHKAKHLVGSLCHDGSMGDERAIVGDEEVCIGTPARREHEVVLEVAMDSKVLVGQPKVRSVRAYRGGKLAHAAHAAKGGALCGLGSAFVERTKLTPCGTLELGLQGTEHVLRCDLVVVHEPGRVGHRALRLLRRDGQRNSCQPTRMCPQALAYRPCSLQEALLAEVLAHRILVDHVPRTLIHLRSGEVASNRAIELLGNQPSLLGNAAIG